MHAFESSVKQCFFARSYPNARESIKSEAMGGFMGFHYNDFKKARELYIRVCRMLISPELHFLEAILATNQGWKTKKKIHTICRKNMDLATFAIGYPDKGIWLSYNRFEQLLLTSSIPFS